MSILRTTLAAMIPLMSAPPPTISGPSITATAFKAEHQNKIAAVIAGSQRKKPRDLGRARPKQGGLHISEDWLRGLEERDCIWRFKMSCSEILDMFHALEIPSQIWTNGGYVFSNVEALTLTLARLHLAGNIHKLCMKYNHSQGSISQIVNWMVDYIVTEWGHLLDFNSEGVLSPKNLETYTDAVEASRAPINSVWGFIDCTIWKIARPTWWQWVAYNGHKCYHTLKFQAVMLPNSLFGHSFGAQEGRRADPHLLNASWLLQKCEQHVVRPNTDENTPPLEHYLQMFGDPVYGTSYQIISAYAGPGERTQKEKGWNGVMASVWIEVEHTFAIVVNTWPFLNTGWKHQVYHSPVAQYYRSGVLLCNRINCMRPNQVAQKFDLRPPSLFEYFHQ